MPYPMSESITNFDIIIPLKQEKLCSLSQSSRKWIAQEFHDSIANTLSSMMIFINYLDARGQHNNTQKAINKIELLSKQLRSNFAYSRNSGANFDEQISAMLEELDTHVSWIAQLPGHEFRLTPRVQHELCSIIREGLHNINKHAKATVVFLSISGSDDRVQMTLTDNGQGFNYTELAKGSLGLRGIQERAKYTGGHAEIETCRGKGTTIRVELKSQSQDDVIAIQLNEICDHLTASLRHAFSAELAQLENCIKQLKLCPNDKIQIQIAARLLKQMTCAVRQIIYTLRGTPASQIALDFITAKYEPDSQQTKLL